MEDVTTDNSIFVAIQQINLCEPDGTPTTETTHKIYFHSVATGGQVGKAIGYHRQEYVARNCADNWARYYNLTVGFVVPEPKWGATIPGE